MSYSANDVSHYGPNFATMLLGYVGVHGKH
jgi:hypothetical protein